MLYITNKLSKFLWLQSPLWQFRKWSALCRQRTSLEAASHRQNNITLIPGSPAMDQIILPPSFRITNSLVLSMTPSQCCHWMPPTTTWPVPRGLSIILQGLCLWVIRIPNLYISLIELLVLLLEVPTGQPEKLIGASRLVNRTEWHDLLGRHLRDGSMKYVAISSVYLWFDWS